jgi:hypothetical protein
MSYVGNNILSWDATIVLNSITDEFYTKRSFGKIGSKKFIEHSKGET